MSLIIEFDLIYSLYLMFTTSARILPSSTSFSDIIFYFMLDGQRIQSPFTRVGSYEGMSTYEYHSVSLNHYFQAMPPGTYNFTIELISESAGNFIRESSFNIIGLPNN
ncbi:MAG: hypothetical protein ACFFD1_13175 [Candidatus Thorarchaeota archaeon]